MAVDARTYTSQVKIKVNGTDLDDVTLSSVAEVVVEQSLNLPSMFLIRVYDFDLAGASAFGLTDGDKFKVGAKVEILLGRDQRAESVLKGEITSLELEADAETGPIITVRGYDRAHRLHRGRKTQSFLSSADSDIATKVAQGASLRPITHATTERHDFVWQHNQTDWEFLNERAARNGYEVFVEDESLYFQAPLSGAARAPEQKYAQNLMSFRVTLSSLFQADEVVVRGWDPDQKQSIVGTASRGELHPEIGLGKTGKQVASSFGAAKVSVVDRPIATQGEATQMAQAIYNDLDGTFIQAEASCFGEPGIKPRKKIKISGVGNRFSGDYYITAATHRVTATEGYKTSFVVTGRQTNSVLELTQGRQEGGRLPSIVIGIVTDNADPDNLGRVKVKLPWLTDDDTTWWARLSSPMAGNGRGIYFIPEVNDEVLVAFEHGDINRAFIIGALWNKKDTPPKPTSEVVSGAHVNQRILKTRAGHTVTFDDTEGAEKITIVDKTGKNQIEIDSSSNKISIKADGDVTIDAGGNATVNTQKNATVKANQNVDVEATQNATVKATQNATVEAQANATVKAGANASVTANASLDLKANANVNIESGGVMTIKATGPLNLQGAVVKIN